MKQYKLTYKSVFAKIASIRLPTPNRIVEKDRNRIISLWCVRQNNDSASVVRGVSLLVHENPLLPLEPSGACFQGFRGRVQPSQLEDTFVTGDYSCNRRLLL